MDKFAVIGTRITYEEYFGTVRYVGEVAGTAGQWLGIEWDDKTRGKHNGSHHGIQYFKTEYPSAGSFVRLKKVNFGIPIIDGIKERYGSAKEQEENFGISHENLILPQAPGSQTRIIEVVGMKDISEAQSKYDALKVVSLRGMHINGAGPSNMLSELSPRILELDLSKNLIPSWSSLAEITVQLPNLRFLNISENRLSMPKEPQKLVAAYKSVRQLLLQKMNYNWNQVLTCLQLFPNLEYLALAGNRVNHLTSPPANILCKLKELNLEFNGLIDWEEIMKLGNLPNLESMNISNNEISSICFKDAHWNQKSQFFTSLRVLSISNNNILTWKNLAELNKLKKLENLTVRYNPVVNSYKIENIRMNLVGRLAELKVHNHSEIVKVDRKGSEYEYFRAYSKIYVTASADPNTLEEFCQEHPRYMFLISLFGAPDPAEIEEKSRALKSNLIKVIIKSCQASEDKTFTKKISCTMSVKKLKAFIQRLMKYNNIQNLELSFKDNNDSDVEIALDNDLRQLSFYSIENNSIILARWR